MKFDVHQSSMLGDQLYPPSERHNSYGKQDIDIDMRVLTLPDELDIVEVVKDDCRTAGFKQFRVICVKAAKMPQFSVSLYAVRALW